MKVLVVVTGAMLVAGSVVAQESYRPGHSGLTVEEYEALASSSHGAWEKFNVAVDREVRPAVAETLSNPTRVFFHEFGHSKDGKDGLRVVHQKDYTVDGETRMVSVITFWTLDLATGKPVMQTGADTLRVRAEHNDPKDFDRVEFIGLSYDTQTDASGAVTGATPYFTKDKRAQVHQVMPGSCNGCHNGGARNARNAPTVPPSEQEGYGDFLKWSEEKLTERWSAATDDEKPAAERFADDTMERLAAMRNDPAGFVAAGLREAFGGNDPNVVGAANAAVGVVAINGAPLRPLHHWNGGRYNGTNEKAPGPAAAKPAVGAGMLRD